MRIVNRIIPVVTIAAVTCSSITCGKSQEVKNNYCGISIDSVASNPSIDQREILSKYGIPHFIWHNPFGVYKWVYCLHGSPIRVFDFDEQGSLLGQSNGGRQGLCSDAVKIDQEISQVEKRSTQQSIKFESLLEKAKRCFSQRHLPGMAIQSLLASEEALLIQPNDFEANLLAARTILYIASDLKPSKKRKWIAHRGYKIGKILIEHYPKRVEGYFFAGVNLGLRAECMGKLAALSENVKKRVEDLIDQAIRIDRDFLHGAPLIAKANFLLMLPRPMRDREKAVKIMIEVKRKFPRNPYVDLFFADLAIGDGEMEKARELLEAMIRRLPDSSYDYSDGVTVRRWVIKRLEILGNKPQKGEEE